MRVMYIFTAWEIRPNRSDGQVVSGADCNLNGSGSLPTRDTDCRFSGQCKVIELLAFYDVITGLTEFISIVNSVKMVNMPDSHDYPTLQEGNSLGILLLYYMKSDQNNSGCTHMETSAFSYKLMQNKIIEFQYLKGLYTLCS